MKNGTKGELNGKITQINNAKVDFLGKMKDSGDKFLTGDVYKTDYKGNYSIIYNPQNVFSQLNITEPITNSLPPIIVIIVN